MFLTATSFRESSITSIKNRQKNGNRTLPVKRTFTTTRMQIVTTARWDNP